MPFGINCLDRGLTGIFELKFPAIDLMYYRVVLGDLGHFLLVVIVGHIWL